MKKKLIQFISFGCLGTTTEIWFTAVVDNANRLGDGLPMDWSLGGNSYIWMFFIYGLAAPLFGFFYKWIKHFPLLIRLLIYTLGIFVVEFITGGLLDLITGSCPWEYTNKWNICGYIRLDYAPSWFIFGLILEKVYLYLNR